MHLPGMLGKKKWQWSCYLMQAWGYKEKVWNKNAVCLVQYRVTTVKTIAIRWLFILQPIKAIQLLKHSVHAVLLEGVWLRPVFFRMTCRLGTFSFFWRYVWTLNSFFFSTWKNLIFSKLGQISFFSYSTYIHWNVWEVLEVSSIEKWGHQSCTLFWRKKLPRGWSIIKPQENWLICSKLMSI